MQRIPYLPSFDCMIRSLTGILCALSVVVYCTIWIVAVSTGRSGVVGYGCTLSHVAILGFGFFWFVKFVGSDLKALSLFGGAQLMLLGTDLVFAEAVVAVVVSTLGSAVVVVSCLLVPVFQAELLIQMLLVLGVTVWEGGVGLSAIKGHMSAGLSLFGIGAAIVLFSFYRVGVAAAAKPRPQRTRRSYDSTV